MINFLNLSLCKRKCSIIFSWLMKKWTRFAEFSRSWESQELVTDSRKALKNLNSGALKKFKAWVRRVNCLKKINSSISVNTQPISLKLSWTIVFRKNFYLMATIPTTKVTCRVTWSKRCSINFYRNW